MHRDPDAHRRPHRGDLLEDLEVDLVGLPAAAVLLGVGQAQQPGLAQHREHVAREGLGGLRLGGARGQLAGRDLAGEGEEVSRLLGGQHAAGGHAVVLPGVWAVER